MTAHNTAHGEPAALYESKVCDRLKPILRTGGDEPATGRQEGRDQSLVELDGYESQIFHGTNCELGAANQVRAFQDAFDRRVDILEFG